MDYNKIVPKQDTAPKMVMPAVVSANGNIYRASIGSVDKNPLGNICPGC